VLSSHTPILLLCSYVFFKYNNSKRNGTNIINNNNLYFEKNENNKKTKTKQKITQTPFPSPQKNKTKKNKKKTKQNIKK
jgi:predicted ATP-grasp superfamily ATP-dependent carboligase